MIQARTGKTMFLLAVVAGLLCFLVTAAPPAVAEDMVRLEIKLTAKKSGKPIKNASVYVKFKQKRLLRRDKKKEWSVKTNPEGRAVVPRLPEGNVLIQVIAPGWKTYGKFHEIKGPKQVIEIALDKPPKWY